MRTTPYASRLYRWLLQLTREVFQDFKYTLRLWASRPWHAGLAITALAIGIGANTGVFSVVDALLLRSLPFHEPDRLAPLHQFIPPHDSAKEFHDWRQQDAYLAAVFGAKTREQRLDDQSSTGPRFGFLRDSHYCWR